MEGPGDIDIDNLISSKEVFGNFIYTPLSSALKEIKLRKSDPKLDNYIISTMPSEMPVFLRNKDYAFLSRDLATPNYETRRFLDLVDSIDELSPLLWEYYSDKFTPNVNMSKYNIAKPTFYIGPDRKGNNRIRSMNIVDFNTYNGKKISEINTIWNQGFVDFHHEFLNSELLKISGKEVKYFDATEWYHHCGGDVMVYYKYLMIIFLKNGILFDNFLLNDTEEGDFIKEIFLPAFISVFRESGYKPLIVQLFPSDTEDSNMWMYYPYNSISFIKNKINLI